MEKTDVKVRCQRIGCNATFTDDDNLDDSCQYHESGPLFHDGMKEWSCCKKRSHDFSLFLEIPGIDRKKRLPRLNVLRCKTGKHTTEKQVIAPIKKKHVPPPTAAPSTNASMKDSSCSRCRQGFFCSDHGSQGKPVTTIGDKPLNLSGDASAVSSSSVKASKPPPKIVDINEPQTCKNKGCGQTFKERDNHDSACSYHPGPAVFHDRMKGWDCCDIHVNEFDEFIAIPPCTKGWHNADPVS